MSDTPQSPTHGRIVVGTDLSPRTGPAIEWAAKRADAAGVPLLVTLVVPPGPLLLRNGIDDAAIVADIGRHLHDRGEQKLADEKARIAQAHPDLVVETRLYEGDTISTLADATDSAALVVVGARGSTMPIAIPAVGGTSDALVTRARGPVAVVTDAVQATAGGPVVVGVDDSPASVEALRVAVDEAVALGVGVEAIHAWDVGPWMADMLVGWSVDQATMGGTLESMMDALISPYAQEHPHLRIERRLVPGRASDVLGSASEGASLLVVGSRGRGGLAGLFFGSTSREVLRRAKCPVIVVRAPGEEPASGR